MKYDGASVAYVNGTRIEVASVPFEQLREKETAREPDLCIERVELLLKEEFIVPLKFARGAASSGQINGIGGISLGRAT